MGIFNLHGTWLKGNMVEWKQSKSFLEGVKDGFLIRHCMGQQRTT